MNYKKLRKQRHQEEIDALPTLSNQALLELVIYLATELSYSDTDEYDVKIYDIYKKELSRRLIEVKWIEKEIA